MTPDERIFESAPSWLKRFRPGQIIFSEGDPSSLMFRVESGCVRLQVNGAEGSRQIVSFLFKGDLFGYAIEDRKISAEAVGDTVLRCWSMPSVLALGSRSPEVAIALIRMADRQYSDIAHHLEKVTHLSATDSVRWFFSGLVNCAGLRKSDGHLELPMTRKDIADYLSLSAETLSRAISELEIDGFLQREGRRGFRLQGPALALRVQSPSQLEIAPA